MFFSGVYVKMLTVGASGRVTIPKEACNHSGINYVHWVNREHKEDNGTIFILQDKLSTKDTSALRDDSGNLRISTGLEKGSKIVVVVQKSMITLVLK